MKTMSGKCPTAHSAFHRSLGFGRSVCLCLETMVVRCGSQVWDYTDCTAITCISLDFVFDYIYKGVIWNLNVRLLDVQISFHCSLDRQQFGDAVL